MEKMEDKLVKSNHGPSYYNFQKLLAAFSLLLVGAYTVIRFLYK